MSQDDKKPVGAPPTQEDALRACDDLGRQIERSAKVLRGYEDTLRVPSSSNDNGKAKRS